MTDLSYYDKVREAADFIRARSGGHSPLTALVLGSGLGKAAESAEQAVVISTSEIPHWPLSTAPGHAGKLILGRIGGRETAVLSGRVHLYEGYSMRDVTFGTRVMGELGVRQYIATNASGAISRDLVPGDIMMLTDHINMTGRNPLTGPNEDRWNVRFPDMTHVYSRRLASIMERASHDVHVMLQRGVYAMMSGPSFETPAEVRMLGVLGADAVGMSTVPEMIVANAMGMEAAALSCVANMAAGLTDSPLTEQEVLDAMAMASQTLASLIGAFIARLVSEGDER